MRPTTREGGLGVIYSTRFASSFYSTREETFVQQSSSFPFFFLFFFLFFFFFFFFLSLGRGERTSEFN
jgi:ABC-type multidrug transport system permease subunit